MRRAPGIKGFVTLRLEPHHFSGVRLALPGGDAAQINGVLLPRCNQLGQKLPGVSGTRTMLGMFLHVNLPRCDLDNGAPGQFGSFYRWLIFILPAFPRHVRLRRESVQLAATLLCICSGT